MSPPADSSVKAAEQPGRPELDWRLFVAVAATLCVTNLDYNGPSIDESFYSVAKRFGNVPHLSSDYRLWPMLSCFAYDAGGLAAVRALAGLFGTFTVAFVYKAAQAVLGPGRKDLPLYAAFFSHSRRPPSW